jgi:uncharacterized repeat protein (TIGR01451 family)
VKKQLIIITLITLFAIISASAVSAADTNNTTLPDPLNTRTEISYITIQSAIDDPLTLDGDTIDVEPGTYNENVVVNKNLTIRATGPNTIVNGSFTITATGSGSTIQGFTINNATKTNVFSENFDSVSAPTLPSGWEVVDVEGSNGDWVTYPGTRFPSGYGAHSGPNVVYFNSFSATQENNARLYRTTGLDLSGLSSAYVSFWMFHDTGFNGFNDRVQLQVSTDGGLTWNNVGSAINRVDGSTGWKQHSISISSYTDLNDVRIGFLGISGFGNDCHLDDIEVKTGVTSETNGIFVNGASYVTLTGNTINGFIAGNGISLNSANHNTITQNTINNCLNGIYTFESSNNIISENTVSNNANVGIFITETSTGNNIINNIAKNMNGYGIYLNRFCDNNNIEGNHITTSSLDGITIGASTGNTIKKNFIAYNNKYGIWSNYYGNIITENTIINNYRGIGLSNYLENGQAESIFFNSIVNNSEYNFINLQPLNHGLPAVSYNWWGSNSPDSSKISGLGTFGPWIFMTINATPDTIKNGQTSLVTVSFNNAAFSSDNIVPLDPANGHIPDGMLVTFNTDLGSIGSKTIDKQIVNGIATATLNADETAGIAHLNAVSDYQTVYTNVTIIPVSSLYLNVTTDKANPVVGDTVVYTLKVGNKGPDTAENVVMTYVVPKGLEFGGAQVDVGSYTYDVATRTVTWTIGDVPVGDPYMWLSLKVTSAGSYLINPLLSTSTYDPTLNSNTQSLAFNAAATPGNNTNNNTNNNNTVNAATNTVTMQETGIPIIVLIMALFMVIGGLVSSKK